MTSFCVEHRKVEEVGAVSVQDDSSQFPVASEYEERGLQHRCFPLLLMCSPGTRRKSSFLALKAFCMTLRFLSHPLSAHETPSGIAQTWHAEESRAPSLKIPIWLLYGRQWDAHPTDLHGVIQQKATYIVLCWATGPVCCHGCCLGNRGGTPELAVGWHSPLLCCHGDHTCPIIFSGDACSLAFALGWLVEYCYHRGTLLMQKRLASFLTFHATVGRPVQSKPLQMWIPRNWRRIHVKWS